MRECHQLYTFPGTAGGPELHGPVRVTAGVEVPAQGEPGPLHNRPAPTDDRDARLYLYPDTVEEGRAGSFPGGRGRSRGTSHCGGTRALFYLSFLQRVGRQGNLSPTGTPDRSVSDHVRLRSGIPQGRATGPERGPALLRSFMGGDMGWGMGRDGGVPLSVPNPGFGLRGDGNSEEPWSLRDPGLVGSRGGVLRGPFRCP